MMSKLFLSILQLLDTISKVLIELEMMLNIELFLDIEPFQHPQLLFIDPTFKVLLFADLLVDLEIILVE